MLSLPLCIEQHVSLPPTLSHVFCVSLSDGDLCCVAITVKTCPDEATGETSSLSPLPSLSSPPAVEVVIPEEIVAASQRVRVAQEARQRALLRQDTPSGVAGMCMCQYVFVCCVALRCVVGL